MNIGRTANPALTKNTFASKNFTTSYTNAMTIQGTVNKTALMLLLVLVGAVYTWKNFFEAQNPQAVVSWIAIGGIGGFIFSLITIFKKTWAYITAPIYAFLEGLFLGGISAFFEASYPGIVMQAVALTFGTLFALLFAYKTRLIKVTQNFRLGVFAATGAIFMVYFLSFILGFFGINMGFIHSNGIGGIIISLVIVVVAALNLVLDFDFIEHGAESGAPKYMEWYAAFGLMVTLIWLYIEILRLLSKLRSRN